MSIGMFDPLRNEQKPQHVTFWLAQRGTAQVQIESPAHFGRQTVKTASALFSTAALSDEEGFNLSLALHVLHHIGWHSRNHQVNNTQHQDLNVGSKKKQWEYHDIIAKIWKFSETSQSFQSFQSFSWIPSSIASPSFTQTDPAVRPSNKICGNRGTHLTTNTNSQP